MSDRKSRWFSRIETRDDALKTIKDASTAFLVLAAIQTLLVIVLKQYSVLFDVAVIVLGAFFLRRFSSRAAAVVLLVLALGEGAVTVANRLGHQGAGGNNVILALIMLWAGVRSVQATFKVHRLAALDAAKSLVRT